MATSGMSREARTTRGRGVVRGLLALAAGAGLLWAPGPAQAAVVYGRVFVQGHGQPEGRRQLAVPRLNVRFQTDEYGRYSVLLPPGLHCVESDGLRAIIQSHPEPIQQDIVLSPGRC